MPAELDLAEKTEAARDVGVVATGEGEEGSAIACDVGPESTSTLTSTAGAVAGLGLAGLLNVGGGGTFTSAVSTTEPEAGGSRSLRGSVEPEDTVASGGVRSLRVSVKPEDTVASEELISSNFCNTSLIRRPGTSELGTMHMGSVQNSPSRERSRLAYLESDDISR